MIRYYSVAALLGAGWFAVLLIPPWTRQWLLGDRRIIYGQVIALVLTSVVVAALFRRAIASAQSFREHLVRGAILPYAGCAIYLTLFNLALWTRHFLMGGLANLHDTLVLYPWGLSSAALACFVVIPYGVACQYAMARAANGPTEPPGTRRGW